jgi:hypothetical protein
MSDMFKPRRVEPRAALNWSKQAVELVGRGFFVSAAIAVLGCVACYLLQRSVFLCQTVQLTVLFIGIRTAAHVDVEIPGAAAETALAALGEAPRALIHAAGLAFVVSALIAVGCIGSGRPVGEGMQIYYTTRIHVVASAADGFLPFARELFRSALGGAPVTMLIASLAPFMYHLITFLGADPVTAWRMGDGAKKDNVIPLALLTAVSALVPLATLFVAPFFAPMAYAFASALWYVAFRDIYLGIGENKRQLRLPTARLVRIQAR